MSPNTNTHRVELHDFAEKLGLSPQQVRDELAAGRLAFEVDGAGVVFTDTFSALDWVQRRVAAVSMFGQNGIGFPLYACDWKDIEFIPGPTARGFGVPAEQEQEAEK